MEGLTTKLHEMNVRNPSVVCGDDNSAVAVVVTSSSTMATSEVSCVVAGFLTSHVGQTLSESAAHLELQNFRMEVGAQMRPFCEEIVDTLFSELFRTETVVMSCSCLV